MRPRIRVVLPTRASCAPRLAVVVRVCAMVGGRT
jgi:hypothetical protein